MTSINMTQAGRMVTLTTMLGAMIAVSGCTTTGSSVSPLSFAQAPKLTKISPTKNSEALLAELKGGVLPDGTVGRLARQDQLRALSAEYKALESAPGGSPVEWKSFDGSSTGKVTAATPYQVGQQNCRQYTHNAVISGRVISGQGAACRNGDGSWTPLT